MSRSSTDAFFIDPTLLVKQEPWSDVPAKATTQTSPSQPSTPRKKGRNAAICSTSASASPSKRTKTNDSKLNSPGISIRGSKWSAWEDQLIKESIVMYGEKGTDWYAILGEINAQRLQDGEEARTMNSLKLHWKQLLKGKMLET